MSAIRRTVSLGLTHARYNLLETMRVPIAVIGSLVFPALALLFFVVPQRYVADDPALATQAVISLAFFAALSNGLFGFGLSIAEDREKPWEPYLRTLPAPAMSRMIGLIVANGSLGFLSVVPVITIGALFTAASASALAIAAGFCALVVAAIPFMFIGISVGYAFSAKAAIAVVQVLLFGLAFGGGLFLPPQMFPEWLEVFSRFLPSREGREIVVWAVQGGGLAPWAWLGILAWSAVMLALALVLYRRDEGRRYA